MLQSMGSQRGRHDWVAQQQQQQTTVSSFLSTVPGKTPIPPLRFLHLSTSHYNCLCTYCSFYILRQCLRCSTQGLMNKQIYICMYIYTHTNMCLHAKLAQSCPTLCHPMDCSPSGSLCMGFSRQEYWSGLPWGGFHFLGCFQPRDRTRVSGVSCTDRQILHH